MVCGRWVGGGLLGVGVVLCGVFYFGFRSGIVCVGDLLVYLVSRFLLGCVVEVAYGFGWVFGYGFDLGAVLVGMYNILSYWSCG